MNDPVLEGTPDLKAWTIAVPRGRAAALLEQVVRSAEAKGVEVLVMRSDMVFGPDHLRSALYHARRALAEGTNSSDSLSMETMLYASGERQLGSAIKKMLADDATEEVVVAQLTAGDLPQGEGWRALGPDRAPAPERLIRFGITPEELSTIGSRDPAELVLEKVAAVDIVKK